MISERNFVSENVGEQEMLLRAKRFLATLPPGGVVETTYEDKQNPARFYGEVCGHKAVAVFDQFWEPDDCVGLDWKTGAFHKSYSGQYEIQGYFLTELYKQKYDVPMRDLSFKFLADDKTYKVNLLSDEKAHKKAERAVRNALSGIEEGNFGRKCSGLCSFCDVSMFCPMDDI
jgi:hypothetical protein